MGRAPRAAIAAALCLAGTRAAELAALTEADLPALDDECIGGSADEECALNAVQMRGAKLGAAAVSTSEEPLGAASWHGSCKAYGCHGHYHGSFKCQCNAACVQHGNCCYDFHSRCAPRSAPETTTQATTTPATTTPQPATTHQEEHSPAPSPPPSGGPYRLDWAASGTSFFSEWDFLWNDDNHGSAEYLLKDEAMKAGVVQAYGTHAILTAGDQSPKYLYKRQTAKIETQRSWKYFLVTMKYTHLPYGCGVWPAFFTLGTHKEWPLGGEMDILEYVNSDVSKSSVHMGPGCVLKPSAVNKYGDMPDRNDMSLDCHTDYGESKLGCAPNKWMRSGRSWSDHRGVVALEWTEDHIKIFAIPEWEIPSDLSSNTPKPEQWDRWLFSYYPLKESGCSADMMDPQKLLMQINFCGDWASKVWGDDNSCRNLVQDCRPVDPLKEYAPEKDCCTQFIWDKDDRYGTSNRLKQEAYFNITYLKVFTKS
eukprot:SRR837773.14557.p1 GENE.SRR837773.14557~~SRR837773.14557.p1  ORF type:complete len:496 (-),score=107.07 SRR837773.14557:180-1622(-)